MCQCYVCVFIQDVDEFVPVVCGRQVLESLHRMEVIIKMWGPPIGNQYFKSVMPDVNLTVCSSCNKVCQLLVTCEIPHKHAREV